MKKNKKEKNVKDIKKIILEIILIPACFAYLFYTLLENHPKASLIICIFITIITSGILIYKYFKEVYIYESKKNIYKIIFIIFNGILIIINLLYLIYNTKLLFLTLIIGIFILLLHLLSSSIKDLIDIKKEKGILYKKSFSSFLSLISFSVILTTLLIKLIS